LGHRVGAFSGRRRPYRRATQEGGSLRKIWAGLRIITLKKGLKMIGFSPPVFVMFKQTLLMIWILAKIPTVGDAGKEF